MLLNFLVRCSLLVLVRSRSLLKFPRFSRSRLPVFFFQFLSRLAMDVFAGKCCRSSLLRTVSTVLVRRLSSREASNSCTHFGRLLQIRSLHCGCDHTRPSPIRVLIVGGSFARVCVAEQVHGDFRHAVISGVHGISTAPCT